MDPQICAYLDEMRREINQRLDGVDQHFDAVDRRFESVDRRVVQLGVLVEQVRHAVQTFAEMVVANTEAIAGLRLRLDAR